MFIVQAILRARSPHVVYFLLASWLYTLGRDQRARVIPAEARKLPIDGAADVRRRVSVVREELDRLTAHIAQARALLAGARPDNPVGRKFDFLCQEFNREANTLCSKSADIELTRIGIDLKGAIERMREQVQNVE